MARLRGAALALALFACLAAPAAAQDQRLEQAKEEAGRLDTPIAQLQTPVGELGLERAELLAAEFGQPIRFSLELDRDVAAGTVSIAIPAAWRTTPESGIRTTGRPTQRGKARGARLRRSASAVELVLEGAKKGTRVGAEILDNGIPAGTYALPVSYTDANGSTRKVGRLEVRLYAPVREEAELPWDDVRAVNVTNQAGDQSETFVSVVPGNANRLIVGANSGVGGYSAWISDNGGTSFTQRVVPTSADVAGSASNITLATCCDPMSAADALGNMWYGGLDFDPDSHIHVSRVAAGTNTFVNTVALASRTPSATQDKPMMTIDNKSTSPTFGRLWVVWNEPTGGGINIVGVFCDTRPAGSPNAANCDNADNWSPVVQITKSTGSYIYADVAVGPDGKVYVTWWNYSSANAIQGATCASNCGVAASWSAASNIATLDATGGPIPFACPILAQPGGRASTGPNIEIDISPTATNGRVWVAWSDLRTGSGTTRCDNGLTPAATHLTFDSIAKTASNALPTTATTPIKLLTDGEGGAQANSDDWFPWITVDQTTGQAYADFYSTRDDATRNTTEFYVRSLNAAGELGALTKVSTGPSDYSGNTCCTFGNDYGDYTGIDATSGSVYSIWSDASGANGEAFIDKRAVPAPGPAPSLAPGSATVTDPAPGGDGDGVFEAGETVEVSIPITNNGTASATATVGTLSSTSPDVSFPDATASYGTIGQGGTAQPDATYKVLLAPTLACGATVPLNLLVNYTGGSTSKAYSIQTGTTTITSATALPQPIPDGSGSRTSTITMPASGTISDVDVGVDITHTWVGDLVIKLKHPDGTERILTNRAGDPLYGEDNLTGTIFDDEAATAFAVAPAPFTGRFRPDQTLSAFDGKPWAGTWTLTVSDLAPADTGTLDAWSLRSTLCGGGGTVNQPPTAALSGPASATTGQIVTWSAAGSSDPDGSITRYEWDLDGNGSFETTTVANTTTKTYSAPGNFLVKVKAFDDDGAVSNTATKSITVNAPVVPPTTTPVPTPTATPGPVIPNPFAGLVRNNASIKVKRGAFSLPVAGCARCKVVLDVRSAKKIKRKIVRLARVTITLDANGKGTARAKLSRANQALLRRLKKIPAKVTMTVTNSAGKSATATGRITLKR